MYFISFDGVPENQDLQPPASPDLAQAPDFAPGPESVSAAEIPFEVGEAASPEIQDPSPVVSGLNPLAEIADFGNREVVKSALTYRLTIKGLDFVPHLEQLRDILSDSKLGLKFDDLKSKIRNGRLQIDRLEASQAAVLAQRLRTLPLEMTWEQKIYE
ncbi:MAG: hypothetical protein ACK5Y2_12815 [Bdellovibrionales bacterium]